MQSTNMEADDKKRASSGVVCSLQEIGSGKFRLVFDDVSNLKMTTIGGWKHEVMFTWKEYDEKEIDNFEFSEKELAEIGFNLLTRLKAQKWNFPRKSRHLNLTDNEVNYAKARLKEN